MFLEIARRGKGHSPLATLPKSDPEPTKSIDMLYKNTLGVKKARPSRKHQSKYEEYVRLKGVISGEGQGLLD